MYSSSTRRHVAIDSDASVPLALGVDHLAPSRRVRRATRKDTVGSLRDSSLEHNNHDLKIIMRTEDSVELLNRWSPQDSLSSLARMEYLEGYHPRSDLRTSKWDARPTVNDFS